jgi:hypothetical protein
MLTTGIVVMIGVIVVGGLIDRLFLSASRTRTRRRRQCSREITLVAVPDEAMRRLSRAVSKLPLADGPNISGTTLEARTRGNWQTNGNRIVVTLHATDNGTRALISSSPVLPQLVDWGRSRRLVDEVVSNLL